MKKRLKILWEKIPLNKKFSILILGVLALPILLSVQILLDRLEKEDINNLMMAAEKDLEKLQTYASTNSNMASAVISIIQANPQLIEALTAPLGTKELFEFHTQVTPYLENIVITNPYIYSLRIYSNRQIMPERYAIFIDQERVIGEEWFQDSKIGILEMRVNDQEELSDYMSPFSSETVIAFYQGLELYSMEKAVVEVSFTSVDFFGEVFVEDTNGYCIVRGDDAMFMTNQIIIEEQEKLALMEYIEKLDRKENFSFVDKIGEHSYLVASYYSEELDLTYYMIHDLSEQLQETNRIQMVFLCVLVVFFILFAFVIEKLAHVLLRRIYETIQAMKELEDGNRQVQIEKPALDEVGQLQTYFNKMVIRIDELIEKESGRALLEKESELKALQNQINSHFLYNVLNNIEMMAIVDENFLIADTITALARLLRYSMKWDTQMVPLANELDYVKDYIQLFNMRFDNEITLICDITSEAMEAYIPKMSVQPVVENAIVHGIEHRMTDEIIRIVARVEEGILMIGITDTGIGMEEKSLKKLQENLSNKTQGSSLSGIGLNNVIERIHTRFGHDFGISIQSEFDKYTKVTLRMPKVEQEIEGTL